MRKAKMDPRRLAKMLSLQYGKGNWAYQDIFEQEIYNPKTGEYMGYGPDLVQSDEGAKMRNAHRLKELGW